MSALPRTAGWYPDMTARLSVVLLDTQISNQIKLYWMLKEHY